MKLFRRLLLSLFPSELTANAQHPVSMFLSLISPRQFFSVIHRRVAENYKLNLYDIALDPFEIKIGFGEQPTLNVKDIDKYYAYGCVSQLNGWNYYAPGNIAMVACISSSVKLKEVFVRFPWTYVYTFLLTIYLLIFVFVARIRVFPEKKEKEQYQRFVELFFSFYQIVSEQQAVSIQEDEYNAFKQAVLQELQVFFFLFYLYKKVNKLFGSSRSQPKEFYQRLFTEDLKSKHYKSAIEYFLLNRQQTIYATSFSPVDAQVCKAIFPADVQLRYLFSGDEWGTITEWLLSKIYDEETLHTYFRSFLKDDRMMDSFLDWLFQWKHFHEHYFQGMKEVSQRVYRLGNDFETDQQIDAFLSSLESGTSPDKLEIPERLKQESMMMDRLMNFYITFLGWFWIGRGDGFYLRLNKKSCIDDLIQQSREEHLRQEALQWYGGLLYTYSKNIFYYSYAYEHIRAWKEVFSMPYNPNYKEVYSNMYLLKLFDEHFFYSLFQDISPSSLVVTVTQPQVLQMFKNLLGDRIRTWINFSNKWLLQAVYGPVFALLGNEALFGILYKHMEETDFQQLKEQVYSFDMHLWVHAVELLAEAWNLKKIYGKNVIVGIVALLRETLFGLLLYVTYVQQQERQTEQDLEVGLFKRLYVSDILQCSTAWVDAFLEIVDRLLVEYHPLLELWTRLDDNEQYFALALENRKQFVVQKNNEAIMNSITGDDVVWCRGFLKTITYYNRRIIRPK